jgi:hypothetical protein
MPIVVHTVTVTHTGDTDHTYGFTGAPSARGFAQLVRERGLPAKLGSVTVYSADDNLVAFEAVERALNPKINLGDAA